MKGGGAAALCAALAAFSSCGLEDFHVLDPPSLRLTANATDPATRYFSFYTTESGSNTEGYFRGTNVYYKIFGSTTSLYSAIGAISAVNAENSSAGYEALAAQGFKQLDSTNSEHKDIFVKNTGASRRVEIRLFYEGYKNDGIWIGEPEQTAPVSPPKEGRPLRRVNGQGFNFYRNPNDPDNDYPDPDDCDDLPASGDADLTGTATDGTWYVAAYAVSVGQNTDLTPLYSQVIYLGYVEISKP